MIATEIAEGIHRVDGVRANVYLVIYNEELIMIDSGMPGNADRILHYIDGIGYQPAAVSRIILTHCHVDHAGSAKELKKRTNAKIAIHLEDFDFVSGKKAFPKPEDMSGFQYRISSPFLKTKLVTPDVTLQDKDMIGRLTIIHTPGHTPGSVSVHDPEKGVLFVGDALSFFDGELRGPRLAVDASQEERSIEKISQLDFDIMLCGHGDPVKPDASEKVRQFLDTSRLRLKS